MTKSSSVNEANEGMLVLTRQKDQKVMLGNDIEVKVINIRGNKVKIGFKTPKSMDVYREEIFLRIQNEKLVKYKK